MTVVSRRRGRRATTADAARPSTEIARLRRELDQERSTNEVLAGELVGADRADLAESVTDLVSALYEPGWVRFANVTEREFDPQALIQMRSICRLMAVKNPLIKRGLGLRAAYVWGQGCEISARANGKTSPGEQDVQAVVAAFLDEPSNRAAVTGGAARTQLEHALGHDGEVFIALFTSPSTGEVQARPVPADEIVEIIYDPQDRYRPWYYRRRWQLTTISPATGLTSVEAVEEFYPAVGYRPRSQPKQFGPYAVNWDAPILHVPVNRPLGWSRGIPDVYAAVDWARAYKIFLEDWATLVKALSRFAWRMTAKGSQKAAVKTKLAAAPSTDPATGKALDVGATALMPADAMLQAIPKSGATIDSESGRPLAAMVAAGMGVPVTMLLGDPGTTGNRATAETLDRPTELEMQQRQELWADAYRRMIHYVIVEAVRAPKGPLRGVITVDGRGRETVALAGDTSTTVDVVFPDLDETAPDVLVKAIVEADSTRTMRPEVVLRLLLQALNVRQVDELVNEMIDPETGEFVWPDGPALGGSAVGDAARAGQDPAGSGPGSMTPDGGPDTGGPGGFAQPGSDG